ncbi:lipoprotein, partial [Providencia burhodogranariea DSM 19968]
MEKYGLIMKLKKIIVCLMAVFFSLLAGCEQKEENKMNDTLKQFQFSCVHESSLLPPLDPEADIWFQQARKLQIQKGPKDFARIASLYRQAAEKKHYKAMGNL